LVLVAQVAQIAVTTKKVTVVSRHGYKTSTALAVVVVRLDMNMLATVVQVAAAV